jgi:hypothetical protein
MQSPIPLTIIFSHILKTSGRALIIAKIKLCQILVKMAFLVKLIYSLHTTFEDGKEPPQH